MGDCRMDGIITTIQIKKDTPDHLYTAFCNKVEEQGIFKACGSCVDKWIMVEFKDEFDQLAWMTAMGITAVKKVKSDA